MNVIEVNDVTKKYKGTRGSRIVALDNVSLSIQEGEIFALLGPNGAGKTTLFKSLLNIVRTNSGNITINGLPPSNPESRRKVGYLAENHRFPDYATGLGLIRLTARLHGCYNSQVRARANELLEQVGMSNWGTTKIKKYSKGMLQRIGLAQAMIVDPNILLLDEPTDGVDPVGKIEIRKLLQNIRSEGKTIVLNSHLLSEVESVADRVAILTKGHVRKVSTVDELTRRSSQYKIEAALNGPPIQIPPEIGRILSSDGLSMTVELKEERLINAVIDELRVRKIDIKAVVPIKMTLEQSFMEAIGDKKGEPL
jgi:ABC-2 type transport system ATP-binding protein